MPYSLYHGTTLTQSKAQKSAAILAPTKEKTRRSKRKLSVDDIQVKVPQDLLPEDINIEDIMESHKKYKIDTTNAKYFARWDSQLDEPQKWNPTYFPFQEHLQS